MIASGEYVPAASWITTPQGKALDLDRFKAWRRLILNPGEARRADVQAVFFDLGDPDPVNYEVCEFVTLYLAEFMDIVRQRREENAGQHFDAAIAPDTEPQDTEL